MPPRSPIVAYPSPALSSGMLVTPSHFVPLHAPQPGADEHIFVFRGGALLVRESDLALPDESACLAPVTKRFQIPPP